jgi:hypothetical protein
MTSLCLHAGASEVSRAALALVPTPPATQTWQPIPHTALLDQVSGTLERAGLRFASEQHSLARNGQRYFGLLRVAAPEGDDKDFALVVGIRNSHDKSFPGGLVCGSRVFVCDNLAFSGEVQLSRKHTRYIMRDLPLLVQRACGQLTDQRALQLRRFGAYKHTEVGDAAAHDVLIRSVDTGVLPVTKLPAVLTEWREPRHPEFKAGKTLWRLFNAFTEVLKSTTLADLPKRTQALHGLCDLHAGLIAPPVVTVADVDEVPQPA